MDFIDVLELRTIHKRELYLSGEIIDIEAGRLFKEVQYLTTLSTDPITLRISSGGGDVDAGNAIIRVLRNAQRKGYVIEGEVMGYAGSMSAIILQACDIRTASQDDVIMIHGITAESFGDMKNNEALMLLMRETMERQSKFLAERNTSEHEKYHTREYWMSLLKDNTPVYLFGEGALEAGLLDELVDPTPKEEEGG